ncbi:hypothetical protein [Dongia sp.]|uniref:hypothetical protein n=1 Tax=Dongia sp. TaxID=1977262 RepID=UPI0035B146BF
MGKKHKSGDGSGKPRRVGLDRLVIVKLFFRNYSEGVTEIEFARDDYDWALEEVKRERPEIFKAAMKKIEEESDEEPLEDDQSSGKSIEKHKNIGAVIYDYRFRRPMPPEIRETETPGENLFWRLTLTGKGKYKFVLGPSPYIVPDDNAPEVQIYEATPEIIAQYSFDDEQALLAKVRYNRLIDLFLGITAHSLQNHLRTTVEGVGQIEIDELYVGQDSEGQGYVVPVQAKGKKDKMSIVQTEQDVAFCASHQKFASLKARPVSAQFLPDKRIHLFELGVDGDAIKVKRERRYSFLAATDPADGESGTGQNRSRRQKKPKD